MSKKIIYISTTAEKKKHRKMRIDSLATKKKKEEIR